MNTKSTSAFGVAFFLGLVACSDNGLASRGGGVNPAIGTANSQGWDYQNDSRRYKGNPPSLAQIENKKVRVGQSFYLSAMATDPEGGALTYRFSTTGNLLASQQNNNGRFQVTVPQTFDSRYDGENRDRSFDGEYRDRSFGIGALGGLGSSSSVSIQAVVEVKNRYDQSAQVSFNIEVTGIGSGEFNEVVRESCYTFTEEWQRAMCEATGGLLGGAL